MLFDTYPMQYVTNILAVLWYSISTSTSLTTEFDIPALSPACRARKNRVAGQYTMKMKSTVLVE
jgi:hypothetical protein